MTESQTTTSMDRLYLYGDARKSCDWPKGDPDYVTECGLSRDDVPSLIDLASQWTSDNWFDEHPSDDPARWAPIHAWRAIGQLGAAEAVRQLLALQSDMERADNDWYLEEFPDIFAMMGPAVIDELTDFLADPGNGEYPRVAAAHSLCKIGQRYSEQHERVVGILTGQLTKREPELYSYNGLLVSYLLRLGAVESAEVIERAYAANVVDEYVCGDWETVRETLGVEELGLVIPRPHVEAPQRPFPAGLPIHHKHEPPSRDKRRTQEKKVKSVRKQKQKARKRNRKRR